MADRRAMRAALALLALLTCPTAAGAQDRLVVADPTATDVSAFEDALVWSREASPGRFRLVERRAGVVRDVPVPSFRHPVDADLGPGAYGRVVAVYARCAGTRRCDVHELDLTSGRERRLSSLSTTRRAEFAPSTWRGHYAFSRAARFSAAELEFRGIGIVGSRDGGVFSSSPLRRASGTAAFETELRGSRLAFRTGAATVDGDTTVYLRSLIGHRTCAVVRASGEGGLGDADEVVTSPVLTGEHLYWAHLVSPGRFSDSGPESNAITIRRVRLPRSGCRPGGEQEVSRRIVESPEAFSSIATTGGRFWWTSQEGVHEAADPLGFAPRG